MNFLRSSRQRFQAWPTAWKWSLGALLLLVTLVWIGQAALLGRPARLSQIDDEGAYLPPARAQAARKHLPSLLPGKLPFDHRPPFATAVFAHVVDGARNDVSALQSIRRFNLACFLVLLVLTYATSVVLGYGPKWSLLAPGLLALSGYFWGYLHSAHSELLHSVFLGVALLAALWFGRRFRVRYLALCGFFLGFALLTRGSLQPFVLALVPFVAVEAYFARRSSESVPIRRFLFPVAAAFALVLGLGVSAGPQLWVNSEKGKGARISANTWRNLEFGLRRAAPGDPPGFPSLRWKEAKRVYHQGARGIMAREAASKKRTLKYLEQHGVGTLAWRQVKKLGYRLLDLEPILESPRLWARFGKWGDGGAWWLRAISRVTWYGVLVFGAVGAVMGAGLGFGGRVLLLFLATFTFGFMLVPTSRLFIPALPVLCLTAPACVRALTDRIRTAALRSATQ